MITHSIHDLGRTMDDPSRESERRRRSVIGALILAVVLAAGCHQEDTKGLVRSVDGVTVYLGVLPAALLAGDLKMYPHGGNGDAPRAHHVVVAMFDEKSGARLEGSVVATVTQHHGPAESKPLEPMVVAGAVTYGNFFSMQEGEGYTIDVDMQLPGQGKRTARFRYEHPHG